MCHKFWCRQQHFEVDVPSDTKSSMPSVSGTPRDFVCRGGTLGPIRTLKWGITNYRVCGFLQDLYSSIEFFGFSLCEPLPPHPVRVISSETFPIELLDNGDLARCQRQCNGVRLLSLSEEHGASQSDLLRSMTPNV